MTSFSTHKGNVRLYQTTPLQTHQHSNHDNLGLTTITRTWILTSVAFQSTSCFLLATSVSYLISFSSYIAMTRWKIIFVRDFRLWLGYLSHSMQQRSDRKFQVLRSIIVHSSLNATFSLITSTYNWWSVHKSITNFWKYSPQVVLTICLVTFHYRLVNVSGGIYIFLFVICLNSYSDLPWRYPASCSRHSESL